MKLTTVGATIGAISPLLLGGFWAYGRIDQIDRNQKVAESLVSTVADLKEIHVKQDAQAVARDENIRELCRDGDLGKRYCKTRGFPHPED